MKSLRVLLAPVLASIATPAFAHHPMGGQTPSTLGEGLLSGIGHPIIGLDHLAFVIAAGVAAVLIGRRLVAPLFFIVATVTGTLLHLNAIGLPMAETVIALSVALIGGMIMSGRTFSTAIWAALFSVAGLFHGFAYGEAVFGAETTPVVAYLAGFGVTQYLIALAAGYVVVDVFGKRAQAFDNAASRITGGMVAGAGCLIVGEQAVGALFG
jgi:urease accessory protein